MNALKIYRDAEWALEHNEITIGEFDERIKPLVDVEAVVRCKDCKHYDSETQSCLDGLDGIFQPDWFCADGERK